MTTIDLYEVIDLATCLELSVGVRKTRIESISQDSLSLIEKVMGKEGGLGGQRSAKSRSGLESGVSSKIARFGPKVGQIGYKLDNFGTSGTFSR